MSPLLSVVILEVVLVLGCQAVAAVGPALVSAGRRCRLIARQVATVLPVAPVLLEIGLMTAWTVLGLLVAAFVVRQRLRWIGRHR